MSGRRYHKPGAQVRAGASSAKRASTDKPKASKSASSGTKASDRVCLRCDERGHYVGDCTRIKYRPLPQLRCVACAVHAVDVQAAVELLKVFRSNEELGAKPMDDAFANPPSTIPCWKVPVSALLRRHGFDKRAALAEIAGEPSEGDFVMRVTAAALAMLPPVPGEDDFNLAVEALCASPVWDRVRHELAWSDWPAEAPYDLARKGVDPLDDEARIRAWRTT